MSDIRKFVDHLAIIPDLARLAAGEAKAAEAARRNAEAGHEGQRRNTIAFMRERDDLANRIARAVAILDEAPDPASDDVSKREAHAIQSANRRAWAVLTEGRDPPSKRRAEDVG